MMEASFESQWILPTEPYGVPTDGDSLVHLEDYQTIFPANIYAPAIDLELLNNDFIWTIDPQLSSPGYSEPPESASYAGSSPQTFPDGLEPGSTRAEHTPATQDIPLFSPLSRPRSAPSTSESPVESPRSVSGRRQKPSSRRAAHNRIERRYRENLSNNFAALHHALQPYYDGINHFQCHPRKQASRKMEILADAVHYIGELQNETVMLRRKMQSLRQTLLPDGIWRYTLSE